MSDLFGHESAAQPQGKPPGAKSPLLRRSASEREKAIVAALSGVSFGGCLSTARFADNMAFAFKAVADPQITDAQGRYLSILAWRYRRQMPAELAYPITEEELERYSVDLTGRPR